MNILDRVEVAALWAIIRGRREFLGSFAKCLMGLLFSLILYLNNDLYYFLGLCEVNICSIE